jgi:enamine deaminase RidA (YjgF/YER057c/UK114 family)
MPAAPNHAAVKALLPYQRDGLTFAGGMRAPRWVFATGVLPTEFGSEKRPLSGEPRWTTQFRSLFARGAEILKAGGSDLTHTVRCDQFVRDWRSVPFFHEVRRKACGKHIPPSTTVLEDAMLLPQAQITMNLVARPLAGPAIEAVFPEGLDVPATSSFVPVMKSGGLVFVAGLMAAWKPGDLGGIAPEAKVPEGHLWKGNRIQLELDYLVQRKLKVALEGAGSSLARVVKADVSIRDMHDVPAFNQVWAKSFPHGVPATTFWPTSTPGFAIEDARIEINCVATEGALQAERIDVREAAPAVCDGHPVGTRAGDLLFIPGLVASDENGPVENEMEHLIALADAICRKAGTRLENVLRIQQVHTDLKDFARACRAWHKRLPGVPLPISAFQVPEPLLVPGCSLQFDLWVYCPEEEKR